MRLVDVDELIEYFDGDLEGYDNREYILYMLDSKGISARVEAIPIEWIKEWYKTHVYYLKEEKPIIYAYEQMIMDWEKENDKDSE